MLERFSGQELSGQAGGYGGGVTPVPFPNTEVKPSRADDTAPLRRGKVGNRLPVCSIFFADSS